MTKVYVAVAAAAMVWTGAAHADAGALWRALRLDALIAIMAEEGRDWGNDLAEQSFPGGGGPSWHSFVASLYDQGEMMAEIRPEFVRTFEEVDTDPLVAFFTSPRGRRIVANEIAARRAFLDPQVEEAAQERADDLRSEDPARFALLREFIGINDLVETNVAASLTFSYAFNLGLVDGSAFDGEMTEAEALADAWAQEDAVREDTEEWLMSQLTLAFAPLSDTDLRAYIDLSRTPAGEALNAALFTAFEPTLTDIARGLGQGVARFMSGRDI